MPDKRFRRFQPQKCPLNPKLAKSLKKNADDFLRSFDIDEALKEAIEEYAKELADVAKEASKSKVEIKTKVGTVFMESFYWKKNKLFKTRKVLISFSKN